MRKFFLICLFVAVLVYALVIVSCGSTWNISGNNVTIQKLEADTVVPAGSFVIYPDSI